MEAICDFVKAGGTMVDFGGMALFKPVRWKGLSCHVVGGGNADRQKYAQKLRFGCEFWCSNTNIPKRFASYPTAAFRAQRRGKVSDEVCLWGETRCFKPVGLKEGDAFIPLLVCETNGYTCVSMARIKYGSDFKGNVILGGYFEQLPRGQTPVHKTPVHRVGHDPSDALMLAPSLCATATSSAMPTDFSSAHSIQMAR